MTGLTHLLEWYTNTLKKCITNTDKSSFRNKEIDTSKAFVEFCMSCLSSGQLRNTMIFPLKSELTLRCSMHVLPSYATSAKKS